MNFIFRIIPRIYYWFFPHFFQPSEILPLKINTFTFSLHSASPEKPLSVIQPLYAYKMFYHLLEHEHALPGATYKDTSIWSLTYVFL